MKTIKVRNGNEIIVSGDEIKPVIYNGDNLSLGYGAKCALVLALVDTMSSKDIALLIDGLNKTKTTKQLKGE